MKRLAWSLFGLLLGVAPVCAAPPAARATATVESAMDVLQALAGTKPRAIPHALLENAQGIAIIPRVLKASLVVGGRHGHGVVLSRDRHGVWSNPAFISLTGGSIGWQVGVQSTDIVLVFKSEKSLNRLLHGKGKLTLGADVAVAAGPVGVQAEAGTDARLRAEIYSYSRSRGLFVGLSLEGAGLVADTDATAAFYPMVTVPTQYGPPIRQQAIPAAAIRLHNLVDTLTTPPPPPPPPAAVRIVPVPVTAPPPPALPPMPTPVPPG
ncbi:MAG TPA: lipid-binding SYLF domain-containing protein [Gemmataceae bacterium]|nr:lipid-binding SYLF domain-containing protein [Gemmataceae bacterium]